MAIFKVNKTTNYTIMSNHHLKEKNMTLKAKGLLSVMLSLPQEWDYSIAGLVAICQENETAIKSALSELKRFGYLEIIKLMPNESKTGKIDYVYNIYETPKQEGKKQGLENLPLENQPLEVLGLENQGQLNTNNKILNNKYSIINDINTNNKYNTTEKTPKKLIFGKYKRIKLTTEEYDKLCNDYTKDFIDNQIKLLDEYVESNNNKNKYSNYNLVLRKSIRENWFNDNKKNNTAKQQDGSSFDRILEEIYNGTIKLQ